MKLKFWEREEHIVDEPMERVLTEMNTTGPGKPEFATQLNYLERLHKLKTEQRQKSKVSPDTIVMVLGNLAGILIIVAYENKHVLTSKGMSFIKPKTG
jgi:hypothetical protein